MLRVERLPIQAEIGAEAVQLDEPLRGVVAPVAQALEWTKPEFIDVAMMRFDVIADFCCRDDTALETERTQRIFAQLVPSDSGPSEPRRTQLSDFVGWPRSI